MKRPRVGRQLSSFKNPTQTKAELRARARLNDRNGKRIEREGRKALDRRKARK
jgi:hypothetical protein